MYRQTTLRGMRDPETGSFEPVSSIKKATGAAQNAASTGAQDIGGMLVPTLKADVTNAPGLGETGRNAMLGTGLGAAGGAASGIVGEEGLRAARSRNVGGSAGVLDEAAREKMRTSAG